MNENQTLELATASDVEKMDTAKPLTEIFLPFQVTLQKWQEKAASLVVTDISQKTEMAQARLARLELKDTRITMDKTRLVLVAGLKERAGKIDGAARAIRESIEALEEKLLESEQFAVRHAAKLKSELKVRRETELIPLLETPILGDLSDLTEDQYVKTLADAKMLKQAKADALAKLEAERIAREEAERLERERVAAENARLKAEAAENARLAEIERKRIEAERAEERRKADEAQSAALAKAKAESDRLAAIAEKERKRIEAEAAKARAELAEKQKVEQAAKAKADAERKAAEKKARAAAAAPDKAKLTVLALAVRGLGATHGFNNVALREEVQDKINELAAWIEMKANSL